MEKINKIKSHYNFTEHDEKILKANAAVMETYADACIKHLHQQLFDIGDPFLSEHITAPALYQHHKKWFMELFSGAYDHKYGQALLRIGPG